MHREFSLFFVRKSARNQGAVFAIKRAKENELLLKVTLANLANVGLIYGMF
jgi:hypothetical protein